MLYHLFDVSIRADTFYIQNHNFLTGSSENGIEKTGRKRVNPFFPEYPVFSSQLPDMKLKVDKNYINNNQPKENCQEKLNL
jgi:hypothetical protein